MGGWKMSVELSNKAALVVIDVQKAWEDPAWGFRNNPQAESNIGRLLTAWRGQGRPVVIVEHHSLDPNSLLYPEKPGVELKSAALPHPTDHHVVKHVNSALIGTDLHPWLQKHNISTIVVVGLTTVHCCSTTIRMAGNMGYRVYAIEDSMATFDAVKADGRIIPAHVMHEVELAALDMEFCQVTNTEAVLRAGVGEE